MPSAAETPMPSFAPPTRLSLRRALLVLALDVLVAASLTALTIAAPRGGITDFWGFFRAEAKMLYAALALVAWVQVLLWLAALGRFRGSRR